MQSCNFTTTEVAPGKWRHVCSVCDQAPSLTRTPNYMRKCIAISIAGGQSAGGSGTELKRLLSRVGIVAQPGCKCGQHADEMDRRGPDWCAANIDTTVAWMREEYDRRRAEHATAVAIWKVQRLRGGPSKCPVEPLSAWLRVPFSATAARMMVRRAIRNARRQILSDSRLIRERRK
jgi:hypothetical protein